MNPGGVHYASNEPLTSLLIAQPASDWVGLWALGAFILLPVDCALLGSLVVLLDQLVQDNDNRFVQAVAIVACHC